MRNLFKVICFLSTLSMMCACSNSSDQSSTQSVTPKAVDIIPELVQWGAENPGAKTELFFRVDARVELEPEQTRQNLERFFVKNRGILPISCVSTLKHARYGPFSWCELIAEEASLVPAQISGVHEIAYNLDHDEVTLNCSDPNDDSDHDLSEVAQTMNTTCAAQKGLYAQGVEIGQSELPFVPYDNTSYWTLNVQYQSSAPQTEVGGYTQYYNLNPTTCASNIQTLFSLGGGSEHPTAVASMIGSANEEGDKWQAAHADLFYADEAEVESTGPISPGSDIVGIGCGGFAHSRLVEMFEWFVDNRVVLYNESYHCGDPLSWSRERIRDFYTRHYDIVLVRAAGNINDNGGEGTTDSEWSKKTICYGFNSLCVGATELDSNPWLEGDFIYMSRLSRWANREMRDREEPDVTAPGDVILSTQPGIELVSGDLEGGSCVNGQCGLAFNSVRGTSFASPAVVGTLGLALEQMAGDFRKCRVAEWSRAIAKASAIDRSQHIERHWNSNFGRWGVELSERLSRHDLFAFDPEEDEHHGAGIPQFDRMIGYVCNSKGSEEECSFITSEHLGETGLSHGPTFPPLDRNHPDSSINHPNTDGFSQIEKGLTFTSSVEGPDIAWGGECGVELDSEGNYNFVSCPNAEISGETRLSRVVLEWSSCPGQIPEDPETTSNTEIRPATDFNLVLETPSGQTYWMSTSFDDTSESFEFCHTEPGAYKIHVIPTVEDFGCGSLKNPEKKGEYLYIVEKKTTVDDPGSQCPPFIRVRLSEKHSRTSQLRSVAA